MPNRTSNMSKDTATTQVTMTVDELSETDVLFGRGNTVATYPGNLKFRRIVWSHREEYERAQRLGYSTSRRIKRDIALKVIDQISKRDPPGRFVELGKKGQYIVVSRKRVLVKVRQALRDSKKITPAGEAKANAVKKPTIETKKRKRLAVRSRKRAAASSRNKKKKTTNQGKTTAITSPDTVESKPKNGIRNDSSPLPSKKTPAASKLLYFGREYEEPSAASNDRPRHHRDDLTEAEDAAQPISGHIDKMFSLLPPHLTVFFTGIFSGPSYIPTSSNESERDINEIPENLVDGLCHNSKCVGKIEHHLDLKSPTTVFDDPMSSDPPQELTHSLESSAYKTWKEWSSSKSMDLESPTPVIGVPMPASPPLEPTLGLHE
jgi:hypothetical protein